MKSPRPSPLFAFARRITRARVACSLAILLLVWAAPASAEAPRSRSVQEILAALDQYPVNETRRETAQQVLAAPLPANAAPGELAEIHWRRARAAHSLGLGQARIDELRAVIEAGGGSDPSRVWKELSGAEVNGGNFQRAIAARLQAIALTPQDRRGQLLSDYVNLADLHRRIGEFDKARQSVSDAESLLSRLRRSRNWEGKHLHWEAEVEDALGRVEFSRGRYVEAEARFRHAVALKEEGNQRSRENPGDGSQVEEQMESRLDGMYSWLSLALARQGRLAEAEIGARRAVLSAIGRGGQDGVQVGKMLQGLSQVLAEEGRNEEALAMVDRARRNFDRAGVAPDSVLIAQNHRLRAGSLNGLRRWSESVAEYEAAVDATGADRQLAASYAIPTIGWVRALLSLHRAEEALAKARQLHEWTLQRQGQDAFESAEAEACAGAVLVALKQDDEAVRLLRHGLAVMMPMISPEADRSGIRLSRLSFFINSYLRVLARIRGTPLETALKLDAAAEAFVAADALRGQAVQQAMLASSARAATGNPALAELVRREQDSRQERDSLYTILAELLSRPADQALPQTIAQMRQRAADADAITRSAAKEIRGRFPAYADLISPRPATIAEIQSHLLPGEALVSVLSGEDQTLLWAIPAHGSVSFAVSPVGRGAIEAEVKRLRTALDPGDVDLKRLPAFDAATAHQLYTELLAPVASGWRDAKHLFVAAGGELARLPLAVLLTESVPATPVTTALPLAHYRNWPWLIRDHAISQLPSAASLLTLRRMPRGAADRLPFAGFGDPDFGGKGEAAKAAGTARHLRASARLIGSRSSEMDYASIAPLPDTRDEILGLARVLHADPARDVFLGSAASRDAVMNADLSRRRIVAFATHGLLAGEFPGVDQPALALANPGNGQHGLLLLDDILTLKLDADWVILSACNTAAGDGRGGEAISGLGRGFFYSGSRALLVTHWPVETVSARLLVVGVFAELEERPGTSRAEALRQSMLKLMAQDGSEGKYRFAYAHPLLWAPYALVGDGGN